MKGTLIKHLPFQETDHPVLSSHTVTLRHPLRNNEGTLIKHLPFQETDHPVLIDKLPRGKVCTFDAVAQYVFPNGDVMLFRWIQNRCLQPLCYDVYCILGLLFLPFKLAGEHFIGSKFAIFFFGPMYIV